jgi:hypothetical protein
MLFLDTYNPLKSGALGKCLLTIGADGSVLKCEFVRVLSLESVRIDQSRYIPILNDTLILVEYEQHTLHLLNKYHYLHYLVLIKADKSKKCKN